MISARDVRTLQQCFMLATPYATCHASSTIKIDEILEKLKRDNERSRKLGRQWTVIGLPVGSYILVTTHSGLKSYSCLVLYIDLACLTSAAWRIVSLMSKPDRVIPLTSISILDLVFVQPLRLH